MFAEQKFEISAIPLGELAFTFQARQALDLRRLPVFPILPKPLRLVIEDNEPDDIWCSQELRVGQLMMEDVRATQASVNPQELLIEESNGMSYGDKIKHFSLYRDKLRAEIPDVSVIFADASTLVQLDFAYREQFGMGLFLNFFALSSTVIDDGHFLAVGREPSRIAPLQVVEVSQLPNRYVFATPVMVPA